MPKDNLPARRRTAAAVPALSTVDVLKAFLEGRNPRTLRAYDKDLRDFARFADQADARSAVEMLLNLPHGHANKTALAYRAHLVERGLSSATIARRLSALRSVVKLARTLGVVTWSLDVESPKVVPYRDTLGPGEAGWRDMLRDARCEARKGTAKGLRDLAIIRLCHDLLLRRGSVVNLDLADVNLEEGTVDVLGKGQTDARRMTLGTKTREALAEWIAARGTWPGPLFIRLDRAAAEPTRLTGTAVFLIVRDLGRRVGLPRPTRPHALRHQGITEVLEGGFTIPQAMKLSGHADPRTLMIYDDNRTNVAGDIAEYLSRH
jgi:integrase/recombinase XerC